MVQIQAPTKPSTVFLGDNRISGVRPKVMPQTYAMTSLMMTRDAGRKNQIKAFEDVVHHKMCLKDDQEQSHMCPSKLSELEFIMSLL